MLRASSLATILGAAALAAAATYSSDARACGGGMFYSVDEQQTVSVAGHDVVVSISKTRTVLWDRITYTGAPKDFAWVMPVTTGAKLEVAAASWIEAMVGGTNTVVRSPYVECSDGSSSGSSGIGCCGGAALGGDNGGFGGGGTRGPNDQESVTVVHQGEVGPYDTVTIKSDVPGAIGKWLTDNGYAIPTAMAPVLDDYASKGMEFLAIRLKPDAGVQDMKPVRVIMDGMLTTFPMRMLGAGARTSVPINLVVLSEGRYEAKGFTNTTVDPALVTWDFATHTSDYAAQRKAALSANGGKTWITSFASNGAVLTGAEQFTLDENTSSDRLSILYYDRGVAIGDSMATCDGNLWNINAASPDEIVELCADTTLPCSQLQPGQIDASVFTCDTLTDLSTALVGMHPKDVWITRQEADLPVGALAQDLTLVPAAKQEVMSHNVDAQLVGGDPCGAVASAAVKRSPRQAAAPIVALLFGLGAAVARRRRRAR